MTYLSKKNCERCNKEMIIRTTQKKYCNDCKKIQINFYKKIWLINPKNKAKHKISVKNWQLKNKEKIKIYQEKNKYNHSLSVKKWDENNRDIKNNIQKRYAKNNPLKILAHTLSQKIEKKPYCEICDSKYKLEKHHWNYNKPLLINTLCKECHTIQHTKNFRRYLL